MYDDFLALQDIIAILELILTGRMPSATVVRNRVNWVAKLKKA